MIGAKENIMSKREPVRERGAIGKALIVWLASGSFFAAVIAYLLFAGMGC